MSGANLRASQKEVKPKDGLNNSGDYLTRMIGKQDQFRAPAVGQSILGLALAWCASAKHTCSGSQPARTTPSGATADSANHAEVQTHPDTVLRCLRVMVGNEVPLVAPA